MATITEVRVSYQETANLGNYSNVRPSLGLMAVLEPGDDLDTVRQQLADQCRAFVWQQVDDALEANGEAPRYTTDPLFDVLGFNDGSEVVAVLVPANTRLAGTYGRIRGRRLAAARQHLANIDGPNVKIDCSDGNVAEVAARLEAIRLADEEREKARQAKWEAERQQREAEYQAQQHQLDPDDEPEAYEDDGDGDSEDEE